MKINELHTLLHRAVREQWDLSGNWVEGHETGRVVAECDYIDDAAFIVAMANVAPKLLAVVEAAAEVRHHSENAGIDKALTALEDA